ncbi:phosphotransferase [Heyndrickxia sporothermodurans]
MKKMGMMINKNNGDEFENRLLLYLSSFTGERFLHLKKVKDGVWICYTDKKAWVLKIFSSNKHIENQIKLTDELFQHGFSSTYKFHPKHLEKNCFFENNTYGLIEYIEKGKQFTYKTYSERRTAIHLLDNFHETTSNFVGSFKSTLKEFNQLRKWEIRFNEFITNIPLLKKFIQPYYLDVYLEWAKCSLQYMKKNEAYFYNKPTCIIHGDVAHHNFLLNKRNELFLIDFDLITLGTPKLDYLQFANRILPYLSWSIDQLFEHSFMTEYSMDKPFLFALIYPSDIFREWNRFIKTKKGKPKASLLKHLEDLTYIQFSQRNKFINEIIRSI